MARYRDYNYSQGKFIPIHFDRQILPGTFEYSLHYLIDNEIDLSVFDTRYRNDETGAPAYDPAILLKIILYAYSRGITSSRKIAQCCRENVIFMALSADTQPYFTTIADFISTTGQEMIHLFLEILLICDEMGLIGREMFVNYTVTSNHIHLLIRDGEEGEVIPQTMQLIAGRAGQEYNLRKNRKGAYWEDRYHATAVEAGSHLAQCMVYIDLNMVRAGVVKHPAEYAFSGYNEIQNPRKRYGLIGHKSLMELLDLSTMEALKESYRGWVEESLVEGLKRRQPRWTESIAAGSEGFVEHVKDALGVKAIRKGGRS